MIRPALPSDCAAIAAIWNPVIRDTLITFNAVEKTEDELRETLAVKARAGHPFLVAEEAGRVLGFATYGQFRGGVGYAHTMEHTIILAPGGWGRGLGRALMAAIEEEARARGAHSMIAGVSAANSAGVAFHAALGYATVAVLPEVGFKAGRWLDLVLMQKLLT
ncbi:GNAT family N-acetyltransferase [Actibacterium sp. MT2.3-13A]|uniref:GNAT family N-acetyltransferase n=1 Tax=Actibacterium sp. MT2.3-13A TaxID=2828332 RepID=UPI001BAAA146|nr:GNAT family N-acetyltransferase [Actibacterium sp. MT2.3-13A]